MLYTGYMLFFSPRNQAGKDLTLDEVKQQLVKQNEDLLGNTALITLNQYKQKVNEAAKKENWTPEQKQEAELEGIILAVDAQFKNGLYQDQFRRKEVPAKPDGYSQMDKAYIALKPTFESLHQTELWQKPFDVVPAEDIGRPQEQISAADLYSDLVAELQVKTKEQTVIGIPGYKLVDFLVSLTGSKPGFSYWFAALLLALVVRAAIWPLAQKQYIWGRRMAQLAPLNKEIQAKYKDKKTGKVTDPQGMQMETMKMYKEYGFNPLQGCLPMLVQLPLFLIVYQCMLLYRFQFQEGTFLWINPGSTSLFGIPLAPNLGERDYLIIFLYGISMVTTTLLTPVNDPSNAKQQRLMGIGMSVFFSIAMFFWPIPSAFVVYWIFMNILATSQALLAYRVPLAPLEKQMTVKGGALAVDPQGTIDPGFFSGRGTPKKNKKKKR